MLEPRDEYHYSNLGYMLLGEIVARASGTPYTHLRRGAAVRAGRARGDDVGPDGAGRGRRLPRGARGPTSRTSRRCPTSGRAARRASSGARRATSRAGPASSATRIRPFSARRPRPRCAACRSIADHDVVEARARARAADVARRRPRLRRSRRRHERLPRQHGVRHARLDGRRAPDEREHERCRSRRSASSSPRRRRAGSAAGTRPVAARRGAAARARGRARQLVDGGLRVRPLVPRRQASRRVRPGRPPTRPSSSTSATTATWACPGRERGELLEIVRDEDGRPVKLYCRRRTR